MSALPWDDTQDFENVERGFVARSDERQVKAADGRVVWDLDASPSSTVPRRRP